MVDCDGLVCTERLLFLIWAAALAAASGLARRLNEERKLRFLPMLGGVMGSALAAFSFAAFMIEVFDVSNLIVLAMAGPVGWIGGDILEQLGRKYAQQAGLGTKDPGKGNP